MNVAEMTTVPPASPAEEAAVEVLLRQLVRFFQQKTQKLLEVSLGRCFRLTTNFKGVRTNLGLTMMRTYLQIRSEGDNSLKSAS